MYIQQYKKFSFTIIHDWIGTWSTIPQHQLTPFPQLLLSILYPAQPIATVLTKPEPIGGSIRHP